MKKIIAFFMIGMMALGLAGCGAPKKTTESDDTYNDAIKELSVGDIAPSFTAEMNNGTEFSLVACEGSVVLINIWATWCGPCVGEMPAFEKLNNEYGDELKICAVNCMEDKAVVDKFIKENGYTFPVAYDEDGSIEYKYPSTGIPYTVIVDKQGVIQYIFIGANSADEQYEVYKAAIDDCLSK